MSQEYVPDRQDEPGDSEHRYAEGRRRAFRQREQREQEEEARRCGDAPRRAARQRCKKETPDD